MTKDKLCKSCDNFLPLSEFSPNGLNKNGSKLFKSQCKKCRSTIEIERISKKEKLKYSINDENFSYNKKAIMWMYTKKGKKIE